MTTYKYFKKEEFSCKCGCGLNNISDNLLFKLDQARELSGIPYHVNDGTRCPKHNKEVHGEIDSAHLFGFAVDISAPTSQEKFSIVSALLKVGFTRIGIYKTFIHADIDPQKPQKVIFYGD
jgi:zinc D-Ala-D-Ala carboxypeptidase